MNEKDIVSSLFKLAKKAKTKGEIPVSALVIHNGLILSKAYNLKEKKQNCMEHAEIRVIKKASKRLKRWNLSDCDLYVTLKPCKMCEEVIKSCRIKNVYYLLDKLEYKHDFDKTLFSDFGLEEDKVSYQHLLSDFFKNIR